MPAKALFIPTKNDVTCTIITLKSVIQDKEQLESPYFGNCTFSIKKSVIAKRYQQNIKAKVWRMTTSKG